MQVFILIGVIGLVLLLVSLVLGDFLDGVADALDGGSGYLSGPAIGAFLGAFGFGAALIQSSTDWSTGASAIGGLGAGFAIGGIVALVTRTLMHMRTDEPVRSGDLLGTRGTVVTRIPLQGFGEVSLVQAGHPMKLAARADAAVSEGTEVVVTAVLSSTSVAVAPVPRT